MLCQSVAGQIGGDDMIELNRPQVRCVRFILFIQAARLTDLVWTVKEPNLLATAERFTVATLCAVG